MGSMASLAGLGELPPTLQNPVPPPSLLRTQVLPDKGMDSHCPSCSLEFSVSEWALLTETYTSLSLGLAGTQ